MKTEYRDIMQCHRCGNVSYLMLTGGKDYKRVCLFCGLIEDKDGEKTALALIHVETIDVPKMVSVVDTEESGHEAIDDIIKAGYDIVDARVYLTAKRKEGERNVEVLLIRNGSKLRRIICRIVYTYKKLVAFVTGFIKQRSQLNETI